ncbi:MAG: serine/threonine protein kinase [Nitrosospira multiformis]|nr:serine/threonine protein kinase [Nitrosospira multiformis]
MEETLIRGGQQKLWPICHTTDISAARRYGVRLSQSLGFDETTSGRVSLVITEAASNILKHARDGKILLSQIHADQMNGIEILALDNGPGIADLAHSLLDGVTTADSPGTGLGALRRLSDYFDAYCPMDKGSAFHMRIWSSLPANPGEVLEVGAIRVPVAQEEVCGDGWEMVSRADSATFLLADGLGHGPNAAKASDAARELLARNPELKPTAFMEAAHEALRSTRGAAMAVAQLDYGREQLDFVGIGNISACVTDGLSRKQLVSHNGIVGHNIRKIQQFTLPFSSGSLYIMHSDGISTHWDLSAYPGLNRRHPALIAGILYRDFARGRDDASVLVARLH